FLHPFLGFLVAWLRVLGSVGLMVVLALVMVQYWAKLLPMPIKPVMFAVFLAFYLLNLFGVSAAARLQTVLFALMTVVIAVLVFGIVPKLEASNFTPLLAHGWAGVIAAIPLLVSLFLGIESAVEVGEELRDARRAIARGIGACVVVTLVIY